MELRWPRTDIMNTFTQIKSRDIQSQAEATKWIPELSLACRTWAARCMNAVWAHMNEKPYVSVRCQAGDDGVLKNHPIGGNTNLGSL